ncbi:MAG: hypothetical protein FWC01_03125, partial [Treponema sp.]|nr:hypothetical protein [Treponema sp.]
YSVPFKDKINAFAVNKTGIENDAVSVYGISASFIKHVIVKKLETVIIAKNIINIMPAVIESPSTCKPVFLSWQKGGKNKKQKGKKGQFI